MRILALVLATMTATVGAAYAQDAAAVFYVAPNGNDAWSGKAAEPKADASDGPLASVEAARDAVRKWRAGGGTGPVRVQLRGGTYGIVQPLVFSPEDSGSADGPVTFEAYPGEKPVISGGRSVTGWVREGDFLVADLPSVRAGGWTFSSLWVNGQRRQPARTPNAAQPFGDYPEESDTFYTESPVVEKDAEGKEVKSASRFVYKPGDLQNWASLADAYVVVYHSWETSLQRVKNLDEQNHIVEFTGPAAWFYGYWQKSQRYYVEHLFEALDQPGEWFLNRKTGKLYYYPMPGETPESLDAVAPVARQLMLIEGKPAEGKFVAYLNFRGIAFHHTEYPIEPQGHSDSQAAHSVPAAFQVTGARQCTFEACEIGHVATYGAWLRTGSQHNKLVRCEIFDLGAGGIRMGETGDPASEAEAAGFNTVDNCYIHDGGIVFRGAVGAWIGRSSNNVLSHNDICDFRYTGISVGWSWGYAPSSANHNVIEYNHVYQIGKRQLNDMGGIYTLGISPGTVIRYNYFHDVLSYPPLYGGWGIYFDEGSTDIVAENNISYNTSTGTFHQHYGKENRVQNNVFAYSHTPQIIRSREEEHISFIFERNIVLFNNGQLLGSNWKNGKFAIDSNCYWDESAPDGAISFAGKSFEEWKAAGFDTHSIIADPKFVDAHAADFRLQPDSPALALGFKPIDMSGNGLYGDPEWVNKPKQIKREPFQPPIKK